MDSKHRLVRATPEQIEKSWEQHLALWGPATRESFKAREEHLASIAYSEDCLIRWVLVPSENPQTIDFLSYCETIRKTISVQGQSKTAFSVSKVYTPEHNRNKGYGRALLVLLHGELRNLGASCSILYSDVGEFYAQCIDPVTGKGWQIQSPCGVKWDVSSPLPSTSSDYSFLSPGDVPAVCMQDPQQLSRRTTEENAFAFTPSPQEVIWTLQRSQFQAQQTQTRQIPIKAPGAKINNGSQDFILWWPNYEKSMLEIVRMTVSSTSSLVALIQAAQAAAQEASLQSIYAWNVPDEVLVDTDWKNEPRKREMPAIIWYDAALAEMNLQWLANEKYSWC